MELQSVRIDGMNVARVGNTHQPASDEWVSRSPDLLSASNSSSIISSPQSSPDHHNTTLASSPNIMSPSLQAQSSIISSPQSSPDHHNTTPASSPNIMSPSLQAHHQIDIPAVSSSARRPQRFSKEQSMKSLKESIPHTMKLQSLQKSERGFQKDASSHKKAVRRLSKELYMIVSLYALLQGALFAAVAQTTRFTCEGWWGPVGIAVAVTLGTVSGALDKLGRMGQKKQEVKKFERRQSAVYDKIELLYWKGSACNIEDLEPEHSDVFDPVPGFICVFSPHGLLVLGFLVGFSGLIITSCTRMLCRPCYCSDP